MRATMKFELSESRSRDEQGRQVWRDEAERLIHADRLAVLVAAANLMLNDLAAVHLHHATPGSGRLALAACCQDVREALEELAQDLGVGDLRTAASERAAWAVREHEKNLAAGVDSDYRITRDMRKVHARWLRLMQSADGPIATTDGTVPTPLPGAVARSLAVVEDDQ